MGFFDFASFRVLRLPPYEEASFRVFVIFLCSGKEK